MTVALHIEPLMARPLVEPQPAPRPEVRGKFLWCGGRKLHIRGVTYGTFKSDADWAPYRNHVESHAHCSRIRRRTVSTTDRGGASVLAAYSDAWPRQPAGHAARVAGAAAAQDCSGQHHRVASTVGLLSSGAPCRPVRRARTGAHGRSHAWNHGTQLHAEFRSVADADVGRGEIDPRTGNNHIAKSSLKVRHTIGANMTSS